MNEWSKRGVMIALAVLASIAAYTVTKRDSSEKPLNDHPIILKTPDLLVEDTTEEHIVGAWGEVVIKKTNLDSVH